jgi:hypothetical protein
LLSVASAMKTSSLYVTVALEPSFVFVWLPESGV